MTQAEGETGPTTSRPKLAVLIDAENISITNIEFMLKEIESRGNPVIMRAYGNWLNPYHARWGVVAKRFGIEAVQHNVSKAGKNSADIALVIDAIDLLYTHSLDGFCLASSDSDFISLVHRIKSTGIPVYVFGAKSATEDVKTACDQFVCIERAVKEKGLSMETVKADTSSIDLIIHNKLKEFMKGRDAVSICDFGGAFRDLVKIRPADYGYASLLKMLRDVPSVTLMKPRGHSHHLVKPNRVWLEKTQLAKELDQRELSAAP